MRRLLPLLILAMALAAPAGAQQAGRYAMPAPSAPRESPALRGALAADLDEPAADSPAAVPGVLAPAILPPPASAAAPPAYSPPVSTSFGADASGGGQCRQSCARTYYFCLANDDDDNCSQDWGQCRAKCPSGG